MLKAKLLWKRPYPLYIKIPKEFIPRKNSGIEIGNKNRNDREEKLHGVFSTPPPITTTPVTTTTSVITTRTTTTIIPTT